MTRRRLLVTRASGSGGGLPPEDMTLDTYRAATMAFGPMVNFTNEPSGGLTIRRRVPGGVVHNAKGLVLRVIADGHPVVGKFALEYGGITYPVTWGGESLVSVEPGGFAESDPTPAWKTFRAGQPLYVRAYSPAGDTHVLIGGSSDTGDTTGGTGPTTSSGAGGQVAGPVSILGMVADVVCPAFVGDSITHQGGSSENGWCNLAAAGAGVPSFGFGVPVTVFSSVQVGRWGGDPVRALAPATHMLAQFSVNDLRIAEDVISVKSTGVQAWRWLRQQRDVPLYQTTTTPIVDTTNDCATLAGQTLVPAYHERRQNFIAWLRDGAPIDAEDNPVDTGSAGIRAGQPGHPLSGIVDIAAAVEEGGGDNPTGKWRVDLGALGGDGVHPSEQGQAIMAEPVREWISGLTV